MKNLSKGMTLALLLVLAAVLWMLVKWPPGTSADMAAWAQALVTAAALVVALFLPIWQHQRDRDLLAADAARRRAAQLEAAFQLGYGVQVVCQKVMEHCAGTQANSAYFRNALGELHTLRAMLDKFTPDQFEGYSELEPAVAVMAAADAIAAQLRHAADRADNHDQTSFIRMALGGVIDSLKKQVERMKVVADRAKAAKTQ